MLVVRTRGKNCELKTNVAIRVMSERNLLILRSDVYKTMVAIRIRIMIVKGTGGPLIAFDHKVECWLLVSGKAAHKRDTETDGQLR